MNVAKIASENNLADPLTKSFGQMSFNRHIEGIGVTVVGTWM